jgi:hypothetical protein
METTLAVIGILLTIISVLFGENQFQSWRDRKDKRLRHAITMRNELRPRIHELVKNAADMEGGYVVVDLFYKQNFDDKNGKLPKDDFYSWGLNFDEPDDRRFSPTGYMDEYGIFLIEGYGKSGVMFFVNNKNRWYSKQLHTSEEALKYKPKSGYKLVQNKESEHPTFVNVIRRIPFTEVVNYTFDSDYGADFVLYTNHKYSSDKCWSDSFTIIDCDGKSLIKLDEKNRIYKNLFKLKKIFWWPVARKFRRLKTKICQRKYR